MLKEKVVLSIIAKTVRRSREAKTDRTLNLIPNFMYYVYLIRSISNPEILYVGYTTNLNERLATHNSGGSIYTRTDRPWRLITYLAFDEQEKATAFEKYIKVGSGYAFAKKRL